MQCNDGQKTDGRGWDLPILVLYLAEKRLTLEGAIVDQNNNNSGNPLRTENYFGTLWDGTAPDAEAIREMCEPVGTVSCIL